MNSQQLKTKTIYIVSIQTKNAFWTDWCEYTIAATSTREARKIGVMVAIDDGMLSNKEDIRKTDVQPREQIFTL